MLIIPGTVKYEVDSSHMVNHIGPVIGRFWVG